MQLEKLLLGHEFVQKYVQQSLAGGDLSCSFAWVCLGYLIHFETAAQSSDSLHYRVGERGIDPDPKGTFPSEQGLSQPMLDRLAKA